jgi:endogenous inhibitor of DNA gyrase (YacG/DUF329 family)
MTTPPSPAAPGARGRGGCPICGRPAQPAYRPFCCRRCADVDLGRWFSESYRVPVEERDEDADDRNDLPG